MTQEIIEGNKAKKYMSNKDFKIEFSDLCPVREDEKGELLNGYIASIDYAGINVADTGLTKDDAFKEVIISLAVLLSHNSSYPIPAGFLSKPVKH